MQTRPATAPTQMFGSPISQSTIIAPAMQIAASRIWLRM